MINTQNWYQQPNNIRIQRAIFIKNIITNLAHGMKQVYWKRKDRLLIIMK